MIALVLVGLIAAQDPGVETLLKQLEDDSIEVRESATIALIEIGDSAEKPVERRMASATGELKVRGERVLAAIRRHRRVRAVLPRFRRVTIDVKDAPVKNVLLEIRKQSGLAIDPGPAGDAVISLSVKDALPFEALDAACRAAGLEFLPPRQAGAWLRPGPDVVDPAVGLRADKTRIPRAFPGPFVLSIPHVVVAENTMHVTFSLYWSPQCRPTRFADFDILDAADDKGTSLSRPVGAFSWHNYFRSGHVDDFSVFMNEPAAGARKIAFVKGRGVIEFSISKSRVRFDKPESCVGADRTDGRLKVRLEDFTLDPQGNAGVGLVVNLAGELPYQARARSDSTMDGEFCRRNFASNPEDFRLILEDGTIARARGRTTSGLPTTGMKIDVSYRGLTSKPVAVEFSLDTEFHREEFEFEFKDIPLPK